MKGLNFLAGRRAFPFFRGVPQIWIRLLSQPWVEERRKAPKIVFPKAAALILPHSKPPAPLKERFFKLSMHAVREGKEIERHFSSFLQKFLSLGFKESSRLYKERDSCRSLKELTQNRFTCAAASIKPPFVFPANRIQESFVFRNKDRGQAKERAEYFASFLKAVNTRSKASHNLLSEKRSDSRENCSSLKASFLKESMRESFKFLKESVQAAPSAAAGRAVHIGTVYIEGAQIRDFESFKRELSSAVEDL